MSCLFPHKIRDLGTDFSKRNEPVDLRVNRLWKPLVYSLGKTLSCNSVQRFVETYNLPILVARANFVGRQVLIAGNLTDREKYMLSRIRKQGAVIWARESVEMGVPKKTFYSLVKKGALHRVVDGVFRPYDAPELENEAIFVAFTRAPQGVLCLYSALDFHNLTTQAPEEIYLALRRGSRFPKMDYPRVKWHSFTGDMFDVGIEEKMLDGMTIRVYDKEKTIVDCFRLRNQIGIDIAVEALKDYLSGEKTNLRRLTGYAKRCKIFTVMKPYLEAIV